MLPNVQPGRETVRESNRQARDAWRRYAAHRALLTDVLAGVAEPPGASLCVLGPGNVNDLDVHRLLERYATVALVDLDAEAVEAAVERHELARTRVRVHAPVDLTGILDRLPMPPASPALHTVRGLTDSLARRRTRVPGGPFGTTASTGVLTQMLQAVADSALTGDDAVRVCLAVRDKHLLDLVHLTRPGGTFVLLTDVVSTSTAPQLLGVARSALEAELAALVEGGNFFTGTNPYRIVGLLEDDPRFREDVTDVSLLEPWLWPVTPDREHLTCSIVARRRSSF